MNSLLIMKKHTLIVQNTMLFGSLLNSCFLAIITQYIGHFFHRGSSRVLQTNFRTIAISGCFWSMMMLYRIWFLQHQTCSLFLLCLSHVVSLRYGFFIFNLMVCNSIYTENYENFLYRIYWQKSFTIFIIWYLRISKLYNSCLISFSKMSKLIPSNIVKVRITL